MRRSDGKTYRRFFLLCLHGINEFSFPCADTSIIPSQISITWRVKTPSHIHGQNASPKRLLGIAISTIVPVGKSTPIRPPSPVGVCTLRVQPLSNHSTEKEATGAQLFTYFVEGQHATDLSMRVICYRAIPLFKAALPRLLNDNSLLC